MCLVLLSLFLTHSDRSLAARTKKEFLNTEGFLHKSWLGHIIYSVKIHYEFSHDCVQRLSHNSAPMCFSIVDFSVRVHHIV